MNKKGFTLIEILAVIVVLGLLVVIIVPTVKNLLGDSEDALHDEQINMVINATKKYMVEHSELLPEGNDNTALYIDDLVDGGVIDKDKVIDPKTNEEMNGCVVINYNDSFNQYDYNYRDDCSITITFDPEGGSVDTTSKKVMIGKTYGELPTPTREGYTFKGWRGKNMFDEETILMAIDGAEYEDKYFVFSTAKAVLKYGSGIENIEFKSNTQYTLTVKGYSIPYSGSHTGFRIAFVYPNGKNTHQKLNSLTDTTLTYTSNESATVEKIVLTYGYAGTIYLSHVQLEEGNTATEYEPYQEFTSDTIVNKTSDYTLHAIWEVDE